ncbi:LOB domain-containing protein 1-like [Malania oleifera]|uniref:LOB domain-containing protein 1-like n=1 Tax=Malania oleifera TaxID=397392 RepID=UPI0025ADECA1|nr:LOB domain-containing protein 1-like [Malania oleifera]
MHSGAVLSPDRAPLKFTTAHRVFGASNIIKLLQFLRNIKMGIFQFSFEDPVYGCAGAICQRQKQVSDLQAQLAKAQAQGELVNMLLQQANLLVNHGNGTRRIRPISNTGSHRLLHRQRRHYYDHRRQLLLRQL